MRKNESTLTSDQIAAVTKAKKDLQTLPFYEILSEGETEPSGVVKYVYEIKANVTTKAGKKMYVHIGILPDATFSIFRTENHQS